MYTCLRVCVMFLLNVDLRLATTAVDADGDLNEE